MEKRILEIKSMVHISHTPSSTHQASTDLSVYPAVKTAFKGGRFKDVEDIKKHATCHINLLKTKR